MSGDMKMLDKALLISGAVGCGLIGLFTFTVWIAWASDIKIFKLYHLLIPIIPWFFIVLCVFLAVLANG